MPFSRKKSCVRCRQSKARCDLAAPSCSRCRLRNHDCVYEGEARVSPLVWPADAPAPSPGMIFDERSDFQNVEDLAHPAIILDQQTEFDWLHQDPDFGEPVKFMGPHALNLLFGAGFQLGGTPNASVMSTDPMMPDGLPALCTVSSNDPGQLQRLRPETRTVLQRRQFIQHCVLSSVVVGQMTSYPKMMIEGDILPPFICPPCFEKENLAPDCAVSGYHRCLPEDLSVCSSLVRMFYERTSANTTYVWKSIYAECDKLYAEFPKYDIDRQLSVIQALMVYTLLQAGDAASAERNGAPRLLAILTKVAFDLSETMAWQGEIPHNRPERVDWLYSESLSRVMMLLVSLDVLLDGIHPISKKPEAQRGTFCAFPLPCHRDLWLARSNRAWRAAYDRVISSRKGTRLLTTAEFEQYDCLGVLEDGQGRGRDGIPPDVLDIARWAEGLDALGTLVWMILPFQKWRRNEPESSW